MSEDAGQSQAQEPVGWARYLADTYEWASTMMTSSEAVVILAGSVDEATCGSVSMAVGASGAVQDALNLAADYSEGKYYEMAGDALGFASHLSKATGYETVEMCAEATKYAKLAGEVGAGIYQKASATYAEQMGPTLPGAYEVEQGMLAKLSDYSELGKSVAMGAASLGSEAMKMASPACDSIATLMENKVLGYAGNQALAGAQALGSAASSTISAAYGSLQQPVEQPGGGGLGV